MKKFFSKLYILGFLVLTVFFTVIIWKLTFAHILDEYESRKNKLELAIIRAQPKKAKEATTFQKAILDSGERVKHYLGYRVLEQQRIEGHFHHIDFDFDPDKRSYCIQCHGDMPHDKIKAIRAFQNMHASFISCQTCHVRLEKADKTGVFKWYDRTTGKIVASPIKEGVHPGTYKAKIIPFERVGGKLQSIDNQERIDFAGEYRKAEKTLTDLQKEKAKKIIHKIVSKKPYTCEDCHQQEAPVLPFETLGYSPQRINAFAGTEVIGMIKNYTEFYMPRILHPGVGDETQENAPMEVDK
jgi:hypothetical protein